MFRAILLASAMLLTATSASAQEDVLAEMYGRGVHHYYAGNYTEAHRYLTMAIDNGTRDPRPYYFRGLVLDATGRQEEAEADYREGAKWEARGNTGSLIGRSLTRVQGSRRLEIERIREETRLEAKITQQAQARSRYEEREASESRTLRNRPRSPLSTPAPTRDTAVAEPDAPADADDSRSNPFADDGGTAGGAPMVEAEDVYPLVGEAETAEAGGSADDDTPEPTDDGENVFEGLDDEAGDNIFGTEMDDSEPAEDDDAAADDDPLDFP